MDAHATTIAYLGKNCYSKPSWKTLKIYYGEREKRCKKECEKEYDKECDKECNIK